MTISSTTSSNPTSQLSPSQPAARSYQSWLTIERAIFGLVLLVAAALRFFLLTNQPLNPLEAANSWSAWLVANGDPTPMAVAPNSPLLYALYTTLYWALGGSDTLARTLPALCGVGVVWLLWYWRNWLGRTSALIAAALMAIDPWLVAYSRLGDSVGITLFLGMLVLTALLQLAKWQEQEDRLPAVLDDSNATNKTSDATGDGTERRADLHNDIATGGQMARWQQIAAIALGLLVVSGPQMWSWLVVIAIFIVVVLPAYIWQQLIAERSFWLLAIGAAIVGATGWLAYPEGLAALSTSLTVWLGGWTVGTDPYPLSWLWIRLVTDVPLILLFGVVGLSLTWRTGAAENGSQRRFFTAWLIWGIVLGLVPGRSPMILEMVGLPLLLFTTQTLTRLLQDAQLGVAWRENGLLVLVLAVLTLSSAFMLASFSQNATFDGTLASTLLFIVVLMIVLTVAYALWIDGRQARLVLGSGLGLLLLLWTVSSTWALNHHFDLRYPDGFFSGYTNPDVKELATAVAMLSAQREGDATEMALQVQMDGTPNPVLGWYLRDMRNLTWVLAPGMVNGQSPMVVITQPDAAGVDGLRAAYLGSNYALHDQWLPNLLIGNGPVDEPNPDAGALEKIEQRLNSIWAIRVHTLLRWMIYHKIETLPPTDQVVLWVATPEETGQ